MQKRNTYNYELKQGHKVVYRGITTNLNRRHNEHKRSGKKFSHMNYYPYPSSKSTACKREKKSIYIFKRSHSGRKPKYNKQV